MPNFFLSGTPVLPKTRDILDMYRKIKSELYIDNNSITNPGISLFNVHYRNENLINREEVIYKNKW